MTSRSRARISRYLLWLLLAGPLAVVTARYLDGGLFYGEVVHFTGVFSVRLMIVAMAASPLLLMFPARALPRWLMRNRRYFGIASFAYALAHTVFYLDRTGATTDVLADARTAAYLTGWVALTIFGVLAATSNDVSVRLLRRAWKSLHRWVYVAALLSFAHWILVAFDPLSAWLHAGMLAGLESYRVWKRRRILALATDRAVRG